MIPYQLSPKSFNLIVEYEVGGGLKYYNKFLSRPTVPERGSGVTIGFGYDLGFEEYFETDWADLPDDQKNRLKHCLGHVNDAHDCLDGVQDIVIPWDHAERVFVEFTVPREWAKTLKAFPGADKLHPDVQGALLSLVFNRGASLSGPRRSEMRDIRDCVARGDVQGIADALRSMKRLWSNGLVERREAEARLVETNLAPDGPSQPSES